MRQQSLKTIVSACALVAALTLAGPTPAHATSGPGGSFWSWLAGLWGARIATPWSGPGSHLGGHQHPGTVTGWEKAGGCQDPNGGCAVPGTTDSVPGSGSGPALDPQG